MQPLHIHKFHNNRIRQPLAEGGIASGGLWQRGGSHPAASGRGGDRIRRPLAEGGIASGGLWQRGGSHPAASGRGGDRIRRPLAEGGIASGGLWQRGGSHPAASGRAGDRIRPPLAEGGIASGALAEGGIASGRLWQRGGSHPAASGRGGDRIRRPLAEGGIASGGLRRRDALASGGQRIASVNSGQTPRATGQPPTVATACSAAVGDCPGIVSQPSSYASFSGEVSRAAPLLPLSEGLSGPPSLFEEISVDPLSEIPRGIRTAASAQEWVPLHYTGGGEGLCADPACKTPVDVAYVACGVCKGAIYCCTQCQVNHWPKHKDADDAKTCNTSLYRFVCGHPDVEADGVRAFFFVDSLFFSTPVFRV